MNVNICIIRPEGYLWSSVFQELAELVAYSLEDNGHRALIGENRIVPDARNIVIGCHLLDISESVHLPADTIVLNTEPVGTGESLWNERVQFYLQHFVCWDYSWHNIQAIGQMGLPKPRHFLFGYHPKLARIQSSPAPDIDVLFYGTSTPAREQVLSGLESAGAQVMRVFGLFGAERDALIARAKIIINLHQHHTKIFEIVRVHYLMNNRKAILTQCDPDTRMDDRYRDGMMLARHDQLVETCMAVLRSPETLRQYEDRALHTLQRFDAVQIMGAMLQADASA